MSGGIPFVDILIFAIIAIFLGFRLRSILGKRTGFEQPAASPTDFKPDFSDKMQRPIDDMPVDGENISAIMGADPSFSEAGFIKGASAAYGIILQAFADDDMDALKRLLGYEINTVFADSIRDRLKAGEKLSIDLKSLDKVSIKSASLREGVASITVEFLSRQLRVLKSESGDILDGDIDKIEAFNDLWTFERDISSTDPTWLLVDTEVVQN